MPNRRASAMIESAPYFIQSCTATGLRESVIASRSVMLPEELVVGIFRTVRLIVVANVDGRVGDDRVRRQRVHQRARVDERLEARSRLPHPAHRAIERRLLIIPSADERLHVARRRIDRDDRALRDSPCFPSRAMRTSDCGSRAGARLRRCLRRAPARRRAAARDRASCRCEIRPSKPVRPRVRPARARHR